MLLYRSGGNSQKLAYLFGRPTLKVAQGKNLLLSMRQFPKPPPDPFVLLPPDKLLLGELTRRNMVGLV